ncbi:MAG: methionyl-tRNA formyltransferase [Acidobacteriota bacterium]|nr:methionyl-tRNA formyltransferase [Acidobacteriota bacterium]
MRVVLTTRILPVALGFDAVLRDLGHEPVGLLTMRDTENRYGPEFTLDALLQGLPADLDVVMPARRSEIAPLLASMRPDLVVCMGFPWKIPPDALAVPPLGWLNGHPSLLPRHRGPVPMAWTIRAGDEEAGVTFHRMDADLDTGPVLVQERYAVGEYVEPDAFYARTGPLVMQAFATAVERIAAGEQGTPQEAGGEYESFLRADAAWLDPSRPAVELHRLVWAWRYTVPVDELRGALVELDGETVRVLASSLEEVDGARRLDCADGPLWLLRTEPAEAAPAQPPRR